MSSRASTSYSRIADRYEAVRGGDDRAEQIAADVLPWLPAGGVVVDAGAGTGIVSALLTRAAGTVLGLDLSREMIGQARDRLSGRVVVADATALPLADASVDAVTFVWVLHLVGDPAAALREAARVLRPGGRVVAVWAQPSRPAGAEETEVHRAMARMAHLQTTIDRSADVREAAPAAGFRLVAEDAVPLEYLSSAEDTADGLEQRLYSWLWDLDDATWQESVQPRIDELRALPDAGLKRRYRNLHPLWVWERP